MSLWPIMDTRVIDTIRSSLKNSVISLHANTVIFFLYKKHLSAPSRVFSSSANPQSCGRFSCQDPRLCSSPRKSPFELSHRGNECSVNWFIHGNMETQLQGVRSSCKQLNLKCRGMGFWKHLSSYSAPVENGKFACDIKLAEVIQKKTQNRLWINKRNSRFI